MDLNPTSLTSARERLASYRRRGVEHAILLVPFDALSRIAKLAALELAREWGRELAKVESARLDIAHADDPRRPIAGLWVIRLVDRDTDLEDGIYWMEQVERWRDLEPGDPRLDAFLEGWEEATAGLPPVQPPGRKCGCATCAKRYAPHRKR